MTDLNVVLFEPEIPQNTGNIGRLCLATQSTLHLIEPLGFEITDANLKRAGLDYWQHLDVKKYKSAEEFFETIHDHSQFCFFSKKAGHTLYEHQFVRGSYLIFGKETTGLPDWILNRYSTQTLRIPMKDARVRSLNLANSVSIAVYEANRQFGF